MSLTVQILTPIVAVALISVFLAVCLQAKPAPTDTARRVYRTHPGWYWFFALGGIFVVGIFAFAGPRTIPENQPVIAACSVGTAVGFAFGAWVLRAASVTLEGNTLTSKTLIGERTVDVSTIERVESLGLSIALHFRPDANGKKPRSLSFVAAFRGIGELVATLRSRAGLPPA